MNTEQQSLLRQFEDGRTDLVFTLLEGGLPATYQNEDGTSLLQTCAYYGDVSAMQYLLLQGASLDSLGTNLGLSSAAFHGHWRLCKFLLENGADVNEAEGNSRETALHAALCKTDRAVYDPVLMVLLGHGANPNLATKPGEETEGFMRDCRTRGETALHRAAAFGGTETIQLLLDAGAKIDTRDANGDTPLSWASWHLRPTHILRQLLYGPYRIHPENKPMNTNLIGFPETSSNQL